MSRSPRTLTLTLLRLILRLYPARFRNRFADDVVVSVRGELDCASRDGVLARSGVLVACGLALGSAGAWYASSVARAFLFELDARDPRAFAVSLAVLAAAALLAAAVPARRAAGVDPMIALRAE